MSRVGSTIPATRPQHHAGYRVSYDRNQTEPVQDALGQLGNDDKQSNVE